MLSTAIGVLNLLDEDDLLLKSHSLNILIDIVDEFWSEISDYVSKMYVHLYSY